MERTMMLKPDQYVAPEGVFGGESVYKREYIQRPIDKMKPIRRENLRQKLGPFAGEPTYKTDYRQWQLEPYKRHDAGGAYAAPEVPFEGVSTMKTDYVGYDERPPKPCKPATGAIGNANPFEGTTDYKDSYVKYPVEARKKQERQVWQPSGIPLDDSTTFKRDFTAKPLEKNPSCKPNTSGFASNAPFDDITTHKTDFRTWPMDRIPQHKADEYKKPDGNFAGITTYHTDFINHPYARVGLHRPTQKARTLGPFQSSTDYRENFIPRYAERVLPVQRASDFKPTQVPFEGQSTFRAHYIQHPMQLTKACKPTVNAHAGGGDMDKDTTYKLDYIRHACGPCPAALLGTPRSGFVYKQEDPAGHKFYSSSGEQELAHAHSHAPVCNEPAAAVTPPETAPLAEVAA